MMGAQTYRKRHWVRWFTQTPSEILDLFSGLPGALSAPLWAYVPGSRDPGNRALLVAHCDTVNTTPPAPSEIKYRGGVFTARKKPLGGDDRAGVAMLWALRNTGHSLLICDEEEIGGWGARSVSKAIPDLLRAHTFSIEYDRLGHREGVFYWGTDTPEFRAYLRGAFPDYSWGWGSFTDIAEICPSVGLCGVNLSVGYRWQHTPREVFRVSHWEDTLRDSLRVLTPPDIPTFTPPDPELSWGKSGALGADPWGWEDSEEKDIAVTSDCGSILYWVAASDAPPGLQGGVITERDLLSHWGLSGVDPGVCPECGLSLHWVDPAFPDFCPDCGAPLPPETLTV